MTQPSGPARRDHRPEALPQTGVLFVSAPGCASCRAVRARIADLDDRVGVRIVEVAAPDDPATVASLGIRAAPTLIALHEGVEVARRTGAASEAVIAALQEAALNGSPPSHVWPPGPSVALRSLVAVLLVVVGVVARTPSLLVIGAAIAIWAVVPLARTAHELRNR